ncbi:MAG TPA: type II toxin-antitoxin system PemK/MazF family toxin [Gemmatimonadales bacterium]|nr:type II toxin-antitoxin system PemK/MazF family toxin [Gemmatimonadales bacterium]
MWWADLGEVGGREQAGQRPVVVVQADHLNDRSTTIVVPFTTKTHHAGDNTAVPLPATETGLSQDGYALCLQLRVLDRGKLKGKAGQVSGVKMSEIETTVYFVLGLA